MLIEPGVEVKAVVNEAPANTNRRDLEGFEEGPADPEIGCCLPSGQAANERNVAESRRLPSARFLL